MEAGYVMKAFLDRGILDSASYRIVKDSFGDIGTDRIYNKALKEVPEQFVENYNFFSKSSINKRKFFYQAFQIEKYLSFYSILGS